MINEFINALRKYAQFNGRATRKEYWSFIICKWALLAFIFFFASQIVGVSVKIFSVIILYILLFIPTMAISVRRLHDTHVPGWLVLISFIPYLGIIGLMMLIVFYCMPTTEGEYPHASKSKNSTAIVIISVFGTLLLVILFGILRAIALPAYQDYKKRAEEVSGTGNSVDTKKLATSPGLLESHDYWDTYTDPQAAPPLVLNDLQSVQHDLKQYAGKTVLINFWATWCPACIEEMPALDALRLEANQHNLVILTIHVDDEPDTVKRFLKAHHINPIVLFDPTSKAQKDWEVNSLPTSFVIGPDQKMYLSTEGGVDFTSDEMRDILKKLAIFATQMPKEPLI